MLSGVPSFWGFIGACANSRYQAHLQCGLGSRLARYGQAVASALSCWNSSETTYSQEKVLQLNSTTLHAPSFSLFQYYYSMSVSTLINCPAILSSSFWLNLALFRASMQTRGAAYCTSTPTLQTWINNHIHRLTAICNFCTVFLIRQCGV